ncbi:hypothetical protein FB567DRAFT_449947 [Paraphoma chrysanthemicola]|uniref:Uncharacterized protein n=1 Tax=Paraphoma chrysanthemicola TaxID=798071 RepID=A0A8K0QZ91_9PLEO|nr:hypothetical protein FB567DRAFT_449947 [Paraphoma chrysanthemicola]
MASRWVFPPQAPAALLPSSSLNLDLNTTILTYLNISATNAPMSGFGSTPAYHADAMGCEWPAGDRFSRNRTWHYMPCPLTINFTNEIMNQDACRYDYGEAFPALYSLTFPVGTSTDTSTTGYWNLNHVPRLPDSLRNKALLCTFGIPDTNPYELSAAFRFINSDRKQATGQNMYIFNASQPEGKPMDVPPPPTEDEQHDGERRRHRFHYSVGAIAGSVVLIVAMLLASVWAAVYCMKHRKGSKEGAQRNGKVAMAKDAEARAEALPTYEGPPAYNEAIGESARK